MSEKVYNIVIFGTSGAGKSSVVNLLHDKDVAKVGNNAVSVTFDSTGYKFSIDGIPFRIFDTAGFGADKGVADDEAIVQLYRLLSSLQDGISLLVYCITAGRDLPRRDTIKRNWQCFCEIICKKEVPIILLITRAEETQTPDGSAPEMDQWWLTSGNAAAFQEDRLYPNAVACITAAKGRKKNGVHVYQDEYTASRHRVESLILRHHAIPWHLPKIAWFATIIKDAGFGFFKTRGKEVEVRTKETLDLIDKCGLTKEEAEELARHLQAVTDETSKSEALEEDNSSTPTLTSMTPPRSIVERPSSANGKPPKPSVGNEKRGFFSRFVKVKSKEVEHTQ